MGLYDAEKCCYTGLPYFSPICDCDTHRSQQNRSNQRYTYVKSSVIKRSPSHELLMLEPPTTIAELRKAYHKMSLIHHPDKGGTSTKFIQIRNAYELLLSDSA